MPARARAAAPELQELGEAKAPKVGQGEVALAPVVREAKAVVLAVAGEAGEGEEAAASRRHRYRRIFPCRPCLSSGTRTTLSFAPCLAG